MNMLEWKVDQISSCAQVWNTLLNATLQPVWIMLTLTQSDGHIITKIEVVKLHMTHIDLWVGLLTFFEDKLPWPALPAFFITILDSAAQSRRLW